MFQQHQELHLSRRTFFSAIGLAGIGLAAACAAPAEQRKPEAASPAASAPTAAPASAPTAAAPASPTFAPAKVAILSSAGNAAKIPIALARRFGYFEQFKLEETTQFLVNTTEIPAGLLTGSGDLGAFFNVGQTVSAIESGSGFKILAGAIVKPNYVVLTNDPVIKGLRDLEGRTVGIGPINTLLHQVMLLLLKKAGADASKVQFVNIGGANDIFRAIVAKKVDAGLATVDLIPIGRQQGVTTIAEVAKELPDFVWAACFATDKTIATKRDVLVRALAVYGQTFRYMNGPASKDAYAAAYKEIGGLDEQQVAFEWQWIQENKEFASDLVLSDQQLNYMQQINVELGLQKAPMPLSKIADMSLANDALKIMAKS